MFRENHARMIRKTPAWNFSLDEGVWAFWIARFNREYDLGVDAFDPLKWAATGLSVYSAAQFKRSILPKCHTAHFIGRTHPLVARQYTQWYLLNSRRESMAATVLWGIRALFALRPMHAHLMLRRAASFALHTARQIARHLAPPRDNAEPALGFCRPVRVPVAGTLC